MSSELGVEKDAMNPLNEKLPNDVVERALRMAKYYRGREPRQKPGPLG
jgi:hypothetical protein